MSFGLFFFSQATRAGSAAGQENAQSADEKLLKLLALDKVDEALECKREQFKTQEKFVLLSEHTTDKFVWFSIRATRGPGREEPATATDSSSAARQRQRRLGLAPRAAPQAPLWPRR